MGLCASLYSSTCSSIFSLPASPTWFEAEVTSQGPLLFLNDLGSTYGTAARLGVYFVVSFDHWRSSGFQAKSEFVLDIFFCPWMTFWKAMNKEKLEAKSPVELVNGARCRDHPLTVQLRAMYSHAL